MRALVLGLGLAALPAAFAFAQGPYVHDFIDAVPPAVEQQIEADLHAHLAKTGQRVDVVVVRTDVPSGTYGPDEQKLDALGKAMTPKTLGDGRPNQNVVFVTYLLDRRVTIAVGNGSAPKALAVGDEIIDAQVLPQMRQGATEAGILAGVKAIMAQLAPNALR